MKKGNSIITRLRLVYWALFRIRKNMVFVACQVCQSKKVEHQDILSSTTECKSVYTCLSCGATGECHEVWIRT